MANPILATTPDWTVGDLMTRFGPIAYRRFRQDPAPGNATEQDVIDIHTQEKRLYELVDGVLVEKAMGIQESYLAGWLIIFIGNYAQKYGLGFVLGADGMLRLAPGLVRIPDVSFIAWDRVADHRVPRVPMLDFAPDLVVAVLSSGNTALEMTRKRRDYFEAGVRLLWIIDPASRSARVFTADDAGTLLQEADTLNGDPVLPGFALPSLDLFAQLEP